MRTGVVVIGRNEGERLKRCLRSMPADCPVVYVDSGSTDGSVAFAEGLSICVERLSVESGFTAGRARNVGWRRLLSEHPNLCFIQFVDGDCELDADWVARGEAALDAEPALCAVFGRLRERFRENSMYNALCDDEWDVPVGLAHSCGGNALFRAEAILDVDGFCDDLIAAEDSDLCLRLHRQGWHVRRIDSEIALHDADIHYMGQWWRRVRRSGYAYAEHVVRHGANGLPGWRRQRAGIVLWGGIIPPTSALCMSIGVVVELASFITIALALMALYPVQVARIVLTRWRQGSELSFALVYGFWTVFGKFAQFGGLGRYHFNRWIGGTHQLIEYKGAAHR